MIMSTQVQACATKPLNTVSTPPTNDPGPRTRRLDHEQLGELEDFLVGLDQETRCRRFGYSQTDEALRIYARKAITLATCVIGVEVAGELRGVLELYAGGPASWAEVALVVEKSWRQRGLGWAMLSEAGRSADTAGMQTLRLIFSRDNWPMRKLASKAQARIDLDLDEICADIAPSALPRAA